MTDDERATRNVVDAWMAETKTGDHARVLTLMTDNVIFMVPGQEPFGKEAFSALTGSAEGMEIDGRSEIQELQVVGEWAYLRNHIRITAKPAKAGARSALRLHPFDFSDHEPVTIGKAPLDSGGRL